LKPYAVNSLAPWAAVLEHKDTFSIETIGREGREQIIGRFSDTVDGMLEGETLNKIIFRVGARS
jgi:hypothetical protein